MIFPIIFGLGLAAFTLGGLAQRIEPQDIVPAPIEAIVLGLVFALASMPRSWSILPRALLPLPTVLLFLEILTGRSPPMPFPVAFACAGVYALFLTAYSAYIAEQRPRRDG